MSSKFFFIWTYTAALFSTAKNWSHLTHFVLLLRYFCVNSICPIQFLVGCVSLYVGRVGKVWLLNSYLWENVMMWLIFLSVCMQTFCVAILELFKNWRWDQVLKMKCHSICVRLQWLSEKTTKKSSFLMRLIILQKCIWLSVSRYSIPI